MSDEDRYASKTIEGISDMKDMQVDSKSNTNASWDVFLSLIIYLNFASLLGIVIAINAFHLVISCFLGSFVRQIRM